MERKIRQAFFRKYAFWNKKEDFRKNRAWACRFFLGIYLVYKMKKGL